MPSPCRDVAKRANSSNEHRALSARISLASCMVAYATKRLMLCDCQESINEVNAVLDPSFALLDEVFALGDAATKILARHAQGELLSSLATRIVATVPPPLDGSEPAIALRETRLSMVQPLVQPWLARAQTIYAEILELARENPKLGKNPAVANAVRTSRAKLAADTAGNAR